MTVGWPLGSDRASGRRPGNQERNFGSPSRISNGSRRGKGDLLPRPAKYHFSLPKILNPPHGRCNAGLIFKNQESFFRRDDGLIFQGRDLRGTGMGKAGAGAILCDESLLPKIEWGSE